MIYLITGVPGSGKTLYAVSTLIKKLAADKYKDKKGQIVERRVLIDGIPDLIIPHEVLPELSENDKGVYSSDGDGLDKWPHWCKPGDIIVIDEVQRYWRPRGMGTKPPEMIKALETHRHMGVDFILITQNPMLIDQNVRRLVGRHQHVRRLFGSARALIYDWDSCNVVVTNTKGSTSSVWSYPKDAYKLYKSSALHVKQHQKIPLWLLLPVLAIVGGVVVMPRAYSALSGAMTGKGVGSSVAVKTAPVSSAPVLLARAPGAGASTPLAGASAPTVPASGVAVAAADKPEKFGCFASGDICGCVTSSGVKVDKTEEVCRAQIVGMSKPGQKADISAVPNVDAPVRRLESAFADGSVLSYMARRVPPPPQHPLGFEATLDRLQ